MKLKEEDVTELSNYLEQKQIEIADIKNSYICKKEL